MNDKEHTTNLPIDVDKTASCSLLMCTSNVSSFECKVDAVSFLLLLADDPPVLAVLDHDFIEPIVKQYMIIEIPQQSKHNAPITTDYVYRGSDLNMPRVNPIFREQNLYHYVAAWQFQTFSDAAST